MWTNVFKIGELQIVSWFQFLPCDSDSNVLSAKSEREQKDTITLPILSAHLSLHDEGFLTSWTNSFIGPWDPSQGVHNPDEKIKLWLFLPGRHSSVVDAAKASLSGLRVVANGIWLAPGDSEEVATALSHALKNRIERALRGFSYLRFGDVFMKSHSSSTIEKNIRRMQPALEFIFSANEEAIYVHAVISTKNVRGLSSSDLERVLKLPSSGSIREGIPVIVAPHGMRGRVTRCCPSDLVKQVYSRTFSNESPVIGVPSQSPYCQLRGQSCYVEVTLGFSSGGTWKTLKSRLEPSQHHIEKHSMITNENEEEMHGHTDHVSFPERTMIFPVETLLVPILHRTFAKSSLKRMWLHNSSQTHLSYVSPLWDFPDSFFIIHCLGFGGQGDIKLTDSLMMECLDVHPQHYFNEKMDSNVSNISSMSSTTSDGDDATRELEADADSLSCRQSSLSSNDRLEKDSSKSGYKRSRKGTIGSFGFTGKHVGQTLGDPYKSNVLGADNPAGEGSIKVQAESLWDWDDDDNGVVMDIEDLLSEFGDFGDFFEDDILAFGEPPGTAESQTVIFSGTDRQDTTSSPIMEKIDVSNQNSLPRSSFPPFDDFQHTATINSDFMNQNSQPTEHTSISFPGNITTTSKFDYLAKAESIITLASEYSAVETPVNEFLTAIFRTPYLPKSKRVDSLSSTCIYSASTPCSPQSRSSEIKAEIGSKERRMITWNHKLTYYNHVNGWKAHINKISSQDNELTSLKDDPLPSISGITLPSYPKTSQSKNMENTLEAGHLVLSLKTVLATMVECCMLQAAFCRMRHLLLSCNDQFPMEIDICTGQRVSDRFQNDPCIKPSFTSAKYEMRKKDHVPVRIAGGLNAAIDRPVTTPIGVWRPVGAPKAIKSSSTSAENSSSFSFSSFSEEDFSITNQKHPLQKILDAIPFLIQQSTSFIDVSLDACGGDGPYDWLALDEQVRRGFACGPSSVHAGCGGVLASCHSLDIAGVDLVHPLSSDVNASSVSSLLFSEVKVALKSAFKNLDGPLSVVDWCRGHGQSGDGTITSDILSSECLASEVNDSSNTGSFAGETISPSITLASGTSLKDVTRMEESYQRQSNQATEQHLGGSHSRPSISLLPLPALLVGYQDDWLKTSANCLELWEKAPLEPYAHPKPLTYIAVCPDIDILTSATADFLLQLGTIYEACKLGSHSPQLNGMQIDMIPNKSSTSGLVLIDCPQPLKARVTFTSAIGSVNDYLQALSKSWDLNDFLISLAKSLKSLKLGSVLPINKADGSNTSCTVVYVICPFPDSAAIIQTLVESSSALGSAVYVSEKESRVLLYSQVAKDLSCAATLDEASISNVTMLSGFSIPKLALQIVSLDMLLRIDTPRNELAFLKDLAFTVYNKARRIMRSFSNCDVIQSSPFPVGRSQSTLMHVSFPTTGLWKGEHDSALRSGPWDNSWQTLRTGGLNCDSNRSFELFPQDDLRCMFEPLFILAEPGYVEHGISFAGSTVFSESSNSRSCVDDSSSGNYMQASGSVGNADVSSSSILDGSDHEYKTPSLHCCYGWTEDWRWLISVWTDSKGELLDSQIFPFGGISSRQDTKVLQCLFVQVLHQGCQIMSSSSPDSGSVKSRDIIITRIGCFFELECQEWQKAIYSLGGNEIRKWPVQLRKSSSAISLTNNGTSLQQQDIGLIQERSIPSSPVHSMYSPHVKSSGYMKGASGQSSVKKTFSGNQAVDPCGLSQLVQSISLVAVSVDHSLHLMLPADASSLGGVPQISCSSNPSSYLDGFSAIKSLGTISSSYLLIPYRGVRYLPTTPMQLPTCLTSESPPLAHLLHSKGSATPLSTGYVVSKAVSNVRKDSVGNNNECPSILLVSLVDHYSGNTDNFQEKMVRGGNISNSTKQGRSSSGLEASLRYTDLQKHLILESVSAELHSLSWLTASPVYPERHTALPFHCDMLLRSRRLLYYADKQLTRQPDK